MSHNTLAHNNRFATNHRLLDVPAKNQNRPASHVMWLMLVLVFGPMIAIHIGMRFVSPLEHGSLETTGTEVSSLKR